MKITKQKLFELEKNNITDKIATIKKETTSRKLLNNCSK